MRRVVVGVLVAAGAVATRDSQLVMFPGALLTGADGATAVVQAGSPFVRDLIVSTARKFAM